MKRGSLFYIVSVAFAIIAGIIIGSANQWQGIGVGIGLSTVLMYYTTGEFRKYSVMDAQLHISGCISALWLAISITSTIRLTMLPASFIAINVFMGLLALFVLCWVSYQRFMKQ
jgi:hypothetical protein